jgi:hypothetical protein
MAPLTKTWRGSGSQENPQSGNWNVHGNWTPGGVPVSTDTVDLRRGLLSAHGASLLGTLAADGLFDPADRSNAQQRLGGRNTDYPLRGFTK